MITALSIAGSDSCAGAGIQADLKTMTMNGVYGMTVLTALTAQNTTGVRGVLESTPEFLEQQIDAVFEDIRPGAVKIGMVSSRGLIEVIARRLAFYRAEHIVVDPVMVATSGSRLMRTDGVSALQELLLPMAELVTPNIPEGEVLSDRTIRSPEDMVAAAEFIGRTWGCSVLLKGGHSVNDANDLLWTQDRYQWIRGERIDTPNTHGTGCTLSSAIAANLAKGFHLEDSVRRAKEYLAGALNAGRNLGLGHGIGPVHHAFDLHSRFAQTCENA